MFTVNNDKENADDGDKKLLDFRSYDGKNETNSDLNFATDKNKKPTNLAALVTTSKNHMILEQKSPTIGTYVTRLKRHT